MKKNVLILSALCFAAMTLVFSGCKKETNDPQEPAKVQTYQMSIQASKGADNQANGPRRVISLGAGGETLTAEWQINDKVYVYNGSTELGYLEASDNNANTQLNGTLTGTIGVGDELTLKYQPNPYYAEQDGSLDYISANCDYATATVTVATVEGGAITADADAVFANQQAIVKFMLLNEADGTALDATELEIEVAGETYTITPESARREMYVALPGFASQDIAFTATVGSDTYKKTVTDESLTNGEFYRIPLSMTKQTAPAAVPEGGINGVFTFCDNKKIWFSKGNLQYNANSNTWRFAEHQYDIAGAANASISDSYDGWIDLFGWATSGFNAPAENTNYQPWSTDNTDANYGSGITSKADWADAHANYDWGKNAISNGGNIANSGWRTPTSQEWYCLMNSRDGATVNSVSNCLHTRATIDGHKGLILFPDGGTFTADEFTTIPASGSSFRNGGSYSQTTCTLDKWTALEDKGCVFLPAAGIRYETTFNNNDGDNDRGYYWASTSDQGGDNTKACRVAFEAANFKSSLTSEQRSYGLSVRLIKDAN